MVLYCISDALLHIGEPQVYSSGGKNSESTPLSRTFYMLCAYTECGLRGGYRPVLTTKLSKSSLFLKVVVMDYLPSRILNYSPLLCGLAIKFVIAAGDLSATDRLTYDFLGDFFFVG